jgi:4-diphosphocytidyl-2-C-methyl-D-erythritol kinase
MLIFPNAKINIGLNILSRREDGFHNLETIFLPVKGLTDALEFLPSKKTTLICSGREIECNPSDNLVLKAYNLLKERFELPPVSICLHKFIPSSAGLGAGSSDASFMLKGLQEYFQLPLNEKELTELASQMGSDCAFFISNEPAFATAKGEVLEPVSINLTGKHIAIIKPPFPVNTKEAYSGITPGKPSNRLQDLIKLPVEEWKDKLINDFESTVFKKFPELGLIKQSLYELGALYAAMSGSGSAIFGIFDALPEIPILPESYFCWKS